MHLPYFYACLENARKARMITDFTGRLETNEPILSMDTQLGSWNVVSPLDLPRLSSQRLEIFQGALRSKHLMSYFQQAQSRAVTTLLRAGARYLDLDLPHVRLMLRQGSSLTSLVGPHLVGFHVQWSSCQCGICHAYTVYPEPPASLP